MVHQERISIETPGHGAMHDLTDAVRAVVGASGIKTGTVEVFNIGSTAAIGAIEFEPGLQRDLPEMLDRLIPSPGVVHLLPPIYNQQEHGPVIDGG